MSVKVTNNAFGTLAASCTTVQTVLTLQAGQGARFPALTATDWFWATLINSTNTIEIVKVTGIVGDSVSVLRGQDNTLPTAYNAGDRFELRPTAALFNDKLGVADAAAEYLSIANAQAEYVPNTGGIITGPVTLKLKFPQLYMTDTSYTGGAGMYRFLCQNNDLYLNRNTDPASGWTSYTTPLFFDASDVAHFLDRPTFAGGTPWDSLNITPLDKNLGGTIGSALTISNGSLSATNGWVVSCGANGGGFQAYGWGGNNNRGFLGLNQANSANVEFDGTNLNLNSPGGTIINGSPIWTAANLTNNNQLANGSGFLTGVTVAATRYVGTNYGIGSYLTGIEMVSGSQIRGVGAYFVPSSSSSGGGGSDGGGD